MPSDAEIVIEISRTAFWDAAEILTIIQLLETQNSDGINEALNSAGASFAAISLRNSLIARLVLLVTRAYSDSRPGDMHLQRAFDLLKNAAVQMEVEKRGSPDALKEAENAWQKCRGDNRRNAVQHFRDKYTAHLGQPKQIPLPAYKELFAVSDATARVMEKFAVATGVEKTPVEAQINPKNSAEIFWMHWKPARQS